MEIRHVPSCYDKSQIPSLTSTQLVLFDEVHVKQVCGPPTTSIPNEFNIVLPRNEEGEVDVEKGVYNTNNQPKIASFKYEQEGRFCLGVAKVESQDGTIIGKRCPVFDYTEKKISRINAYKKEIMNGFARIRKLTSSSSPWVEKIKPDNIWLCESVGKLKGIGKQGEVRMNEINVHTIVNFQRYVRSYGLPKL